MRIDSCRKCGTELEMYKICSVCDQPIQFHCRKCDLETDEQIHTDSVC